MRPSEDFEGRKLQVGKRISGKVTWVAQILGRIERLRVTAMAMWGGSQSSGQEKDCSCL